MAYDVIRGKTNNRSWARDDSDSVAGDFIVDKLTSVAASRVPWRPVAIVAGVLGGLFVLPGLFRTRRANEGVPQHEFDPHLMQTMRVPREKMRDVVFQGRR